jgi:RNA recognition motif-containing protein
LRWICAKYGTVFDVQKIKDSNSESYGYAFVTFVHPREARHAMAHLNGQYVQGPFGTSRVKVAPSKRKYAKA